MRTGDRREFLADVGRAMLLTSAGPALAADLGLASARAADGPEALNFGSMEPLVGLMQETPPAKLVPLVVEKIKSGTDLRMLVAAGALANARTFGGQDYVGFHTFMALPPALDIARSLSGERQALPVIKVLYRNATRMQEEGGRSKEVLHPVHVHAPVPGAATQNSDSLRTAVHNRDWDGAEQKFAGLVGKSAEDAFNALQAIIEDEVDVHRVVLSWRAWAMLPIAGRDQAHTLLRQSVRYCLKHEEELKRGNRKGSEVRNTLPRLMDQYHLQEEPRQAGAATPGLPTLATPFFRARANCRGPLPLPWPGDVVRPSAKRFPWPPICCFARSGRYAGQVSPTNGWKRHGDSIGVHASDSANAWRACRDPHHLPVIVGYHTAGQAGGVQRSGPWAEHRAAVKSTDANRLLKLTDEAIAGTRSGPRPGRTLLLGPSQQAAFQCCGFASARTALMPKIYRTVEEEFARRVNLPQPPTGRPSRGHGKQNWLSGSRHGACRMLECKTYNS